MYMSCAPGDDSIYIYNERDGGPSFPSPLVNLPNSWNEAWQEAGEWLEEMVEADGRGGVGGFKGRT
jgi:hypothetical protein